MCLSYHHHHHHLASINRGLTGGHCFGTPPKPLSFKRPWWSQECFSFLSREDNSDTYCDRDLFSLLFSFLPLSISCPPLLPSSNILPFSPLLKSDSDVTPHLSKTVFQMTFSWQVVCPLISHTLSICPATSEMKEEVYLYLSSTSVFLSSSLPVKKTSCSYYPSASSLFHPFIISPWPHAVVNPPVCFSPAWPTFLKWDSVLLSVTWKHISQNRARRETQLEHVTTVFQCHKHNQPNIKTMVWYKKFMSYSVLWCDIKWRDSEISQCFNIWTWL